MSETLRIPISLVGQRIGGRYILLAEVGQGGSATIYRAQDQQTGQTVAIKHLNLPHNLAPKERNKRTMRFQNEARTMAFLNHPQIMAVYEHFQEDDQHFMVTEFLAGLNLKAYVQQARPDHRELLHCFKQIAQALEYAHSKNVVHRDIKPENIMVLADKSIKLLDFGIAKFEFSSQVTTDGTLLGTVAYMSPEQLHSSRNTCHQSDIYSLGILMYEILTGKLPFYADSPGAAVVKIFSQAAPLPSDLNPHIGPDLDQLVLTCMHKLPQHRYASCRQIQAVIQRLLEQAYPDPPYPNTQSLLVLPRIRSVNEFRFLDVIETLIDRRAQGRCLIWNAFQEVSLFFEQGQIRQIHSRDRQLEHTALFLDLICWESGNFCFYAEQSPQQNSFHAPPVFQLLKEARHYLAAFRELWEDYQDTDIPELIMTPASNDLLSQEEQALLNCIDNQSAIGKIYTLLPHDRLSILKALKSLSDRQFVFLERTHHF